MPSFLDDPMPEIPADVLAKLEALTDARDSGDISERERSALQQVVAINQRLCARVFDLEHRLHQSESFCSEMREQIVGLVQTTRRLGYEPTARAPGVSAARAMAHAPIDSPADGAYQG